MRTHNNSSGKSSQVGPGIREVKRAARNVGPYLKNDSMIKSSKVGPIKTNLIPIPVLGSGPLNSSSFLDTHEMGSIEKDLSLGLSSKGLVDIVALESFSPCRLLPWWSSILSS